MTERRIGVRRFAKEGEVEANLLGWSSTARRQAVLEPETAFQALVFMDKAERESAIQEETHALLRAYAKRAVRATAFYEPSRWSTLLQTALREFLATSAVAATSGELHLVRQRLDALTRDFHALQQRSEAGQARVRTLDRVRAVVPEIERIAASVFSVAPRTIIVSQADEDEDADVVMTLQFPEISIQAQDRARLKTLFFEQLFEELPDAALKAVRFVFALK